jgi:anti-anti-sigma factor
MESKQQQHPTYLELELIGRLDGYWADQLTEQLSVLIREGHHRIMLNASGLAFMSSAGIRVLLRTSRQLKLIGGAFAVINPSDFVREVLTLSHLNFLFDDIKHFTEVPGAATAAPSAKAPTRQTLTSPEAPAASVAPAAPVAPVAPVVPAVPPRDMELVSAKGQVFTIDAKASMTLSTLGATQPFGAKISETATFQPNQLAWGIGGFGGSFDDCRDSFGEFVAISGGVACLPTDRSNRADYLLTTKDFIASMQVLSAMVCTGDFGYQLSFTHKPEVTTTIAELAHAALDIVETPVAVIAVIGETDGLVGAMMRKSPALAMRPQQVMAHPGIRDWMGFTTERAYTGESALIIGIVARGPDANLLPMLRPMGHDLHAHLHAAAFSFRPIRRGQIDLTQQARWLFEEQSIRGVLHLIEDERPIVGAGMTQMVRGAMWVSPLRREALA